MLTKPVDVSTQWGQSLLSAEAPQSRCERITVSFTENEMKALSAATSLEGVDGNTFMRALFLRWFHDNWKRLGDHAQTMS